MKAHTDDWVAMEDEDDEGEEEDGEEVMKVLFGEEEDEETDIESNREEVEVFELFYSTLYVLLYPEGQHCQF